jgi:hypothetical protein
MLSKNPVTVWKARALYKVEKIAEVRELEDEVMVECSDAFFRNSTTSKEYGTSESFDLHSHGLSYNTMSRKNITINFEMKFSR